MLEVGKLFYYDTIRIGGETIPVLILSVTSLNPEGQLYSSYQKIKMLMPDGQFAWRTYAPGDVSTRFSRIYT